jgi:hypothetical protein
MDEIKNLKDSFERDGNWAEASAWAIVGGLALEVCLLLWFSKDRGSFETLSLVAANVIIAVGVFGEIHFGRRAAKISKRLQQISDERVALAERASAESNQKASEAVARAAEANEIAEGERLARVRLEKELAWRTLTDEQRIKFVLATKQFSGQPFDIVTYQDDAEAMYFSADLVRLLRGAGWQYEKQQGFLAFSLEMGVSVETAPSKADALAPAAKALTDTLNEFGIQAKIGVRDGLQNRPHAIHIRIGKTLRRVAR